MKLKNRLLCLLLCAGILFGLASTASAATYSSWFKTNYEEMKKLDLVPASFASLDLKQKITRGEMCELAVYAFELATGNSNDFLDENGNVISNTYFSDTKDPNISKAYEYGIVSGYPDGTFRPKQYLTRQEFFKIVENFCYSAAFKPSPKSGSLSSFADSGKVADWARSAAETCVTYGYVTGSTSKNGLVLNPTSNTTREEAMTMFLRCYKILQWYYYESIQTATVVVSEEELNVTVSDLTTTMYVTASTLNVRDSWSSGSTQVGTLSYGQAADVTGKCSNGWYRINYAGHIAYVSGSYLSSSKPESGNTTPVTPPVVTGSGSGADVANLALSFVGYPYVWGGSSPSSGFDCSGLMYYCLRQYGYSMNRVADDQMNQGYYVSKDQLQVGDLVFFGSGDYANHVGMYIGNGNFVHASTPTTGVRINALDETYYKNCYIGARRIIGA